MVSQTETEHPSDAMLLATIHTQPVDRIDTIRAHLLECAACASRQRELAADDAMIGATLAELDDPHPPVARPRFAARSQRHWMRRGLRVAGAAATFAVAAAALVVPASPVHRLIFRAADAPPQVPAASADTPLAPLASGIAVPASPTLIIVLLHEQPHGAIEITRTATGDVTFRSRGGNTAYQVASGRVSINNQTPADEYQVGIPRSVQDLRIMVGNRVLFRWPEDSARSISAAQPDRLHIALDSGGTHAP